MALHIIYGPSTSRKSELLYEKIIRASQDHPELSYVFIVPEQMSLTVQADILRMHPAHAVSNIDILTFNRLAYKVFEAVHETERNILDDRGKQMLLRLVTVRQGKNLRLIRGLNKPGNLAELKSLISEFSQYNVTPEMLAEEASRLQGYPALSGKLADLSLVYRSFLDLMHAQYEMSEERIRRLASCLPRYSGLEKTVYIFDGFTGFTPPQYSVLREMIAECPAVFAVLDLSAGEKPEENTDKSDLFYMSAKMALDLQKIADQSSVKTEITYITEEKKKAPAISFLESHLFRFGRGTFPDRTDAVTFVRTDTIRDEVQVLLEKILADLRAGYRLSELAVISGDPEVYRAEITEQFQEKDLPIFFDVPETITTNPLPLLIEAVLQCVKTGFSFDAVMSYAKNPVVLNFTERAMQEDPAFTAYERICEFENYLLALGIRGKSAYEKDFTRSYRHFPASRLAAVNEIRKVLAGPLLGAAGILGGKAHTGTELADSVEALLSDLGAEEWFAAEAGRLAESDPALASQYRQVCREYAEVFREIRSILGDEMLTPDEFHEIFEAAAGALKVAVAPPAKERLFIGDLMRSRFGEIKKLYVIGANDGVLPKSKGEGGLLSDIDRSLLSESGISLAPDAREEYFYADFYLYRMLTKPSDQLVISSASNGADGKSLLPAPVLKRISEIVPNHKNETRADFPLAGLDPGALGEAQLAANFAGTWQRFADTGEAEPDDYARAFYEFYEKEAPAALEKLRNAFLYRYSGSSIEEETAKLLFGDMLDGSVTRLEQFAACPYAHFIAYGLGLEERQVYDMDAADYGSLFHKSIQEFFRLIAENGIRWNGISEENLKLYGGKAVEAACQDQGMKNEFLQDGARNRYIVTRVQRITDRTLWALKKQWDLGAFEETSSEVMFRGGSRHPELRITLPGGQTVSLFGFIDRLDSAETETTAYVRIIDYKSSAHELDYTEIDAGLQLQLLIYMDAALAMQRAVTPEKKVIPAGLYYYHISDPLVEAGDKAEAEEKILKSLMLKGISNSDEEAIYMNERDAAGGFKVLANMKFTKEGLSDTSRAAGTEDLEKLGALAREKASRFAEAICRGEISVSPYTYGQKGSCRYCRFHDICGFDARVPGYQMRKLKKKTIMDLTGGADDEVDE